MPADKTALYRLLKANPDAVRAEMNRPKPLYEVSTKKSILNHVSDMTKNAVGRAISLAVVLDQMDSGELPTTPDVRQTAVDAFERAFQDISDNAG